MNPFFQLSILDPHSLRILIGIFLIITFTMMESRMARSSLNRMVGARNSAFCSFLFFALSLVVAWFSSIWIQIVWKILWIMFEVLYEMRIQSFDILFYCWKWSFHIGKSIQIDPDNIWKNHPILGAQKRFFHSNLNEICGLNLGQSQSQYFNYRITKYVIINSKVVIFVHLWQKLFHKSFYIWFALVFHGWQ